MGHVESQVLTSEYFVESQVLQRLSDSSSMYNVWVHIHKKQG